MWHLSFRTWAGLTWKQDRQILDFYVGPMFNFKWASQNSYQINDRLITVDKITRGGHNQVYRHIPGSKLTLGQRWQWLACMLAVAYATLGQRWLQVWKATVVCSTSAHSQLQTSILCVFANIGPTLTQGKKANDHFVNVRPPSAIQTSLPCICWHWANVGSR